jgi:hypothetical protein
LMMDLSHEWFFIFYELILGLWRANLVPVLSPSVQGLCLKELHLCPFIIFNSQIMHFPRERSQLSKMPNVIIKSAITLKSGLDDLALFWTQVIVVASAQLADLWPAHAAWFLSHSPVLQWPPLPLTPKSGL